MEDNKILFVDLDGTLIKEDLSDLAFIHSIKNYPFKTLFYLFIFLFKGTPYLKEKISKNFTVPFAYLTFNKAALDFVKEEKNKHTVVYLISGSHQILVNQMDKFLNLFYESFGTRDSFNMVGSNKVKFIKENLKIYDFDYLGNSHKDLPIWEYTQNIIFTNASPKLKNIINQKKYNKLEITSDFG